MSTARPNPLSPSDWVARCIQQLRIADQGLSAEDAANVAQQLLAFERTGAMQPENAVDFVVSELAMPSPRFERRSPSRLSTTFQLHR
jgi:hypothetical protein